MPGAQSLAGRMTPGGALPHAAPSSDLTQAAAFAAARMLLPTHALHPITRSATGSGGRCTSPGSAGTAGQDARTWNVRDPQRLAQQCTGAQSRLHPVVIVRATLGPDAPSFACSQARPSSAFRSRTPRTGSPAATDAGDPGAYNPYPRGSLQAGTFHKSSASGAGFFCSSSKREYITSTSEAPGPGAYDLKPATPRETRQSSVFASQSKRDASLTRCESSPGVGAYTPKYPHAPVAISSAFRSTEARFRQDRASNQTNVGPGTYAQVRAE